MESIREDLIKKHIELGMRASGQWVESLENRTKGLSGQIWGEPYTEQLVNGRKPGNFPPIERMRQWVINKKLETTNKKRISMLAFLIARKIAKEGTEYFKQGGTDLIEAVITPSRIQMIMDKVAQFHINSYTSMVSGVFQSLAA
ncbi:hypothetical protein INR75_06680 [Zunongwangia sp. SCSIO 43204]|uniref:hypothetical protein n=1 Tax=Zunongwangia sp. SCSIO 43204 TaxID=2779359 RepID=UPI001CA9F9B0|nr:hypothetical protein [Zunongwangia sp. SCSIO 43204]UAB85694.1 hypothetical protein INR75_06680 [Zunongwangia sp. SCSIO 43204]